MKICVYGAGGVGGVIASKLFTTGEEISIVARGEHLKAIQKNGLKIIDSEKKETICKIKATDKPETLGEQDFVIVSVKGHDVPSVAKSIKPLLGKNTAVVTVMNGIPWWYFERYDGPLKGAHLKISDPENNLNKLIEPARIIGGIIYISTGITAPGVITYMGGRRLMFGELEGTETLRLKTLISILEKAGMRPIITAKIRNETWLKLWGNISFNPISVLTSLGMKEIVEDEKTKQWAADIMTEMKKVSDSLGIDLGMTVEQRLEEGHKSGSHKTSMLQDFEKGKRMELDGIIGTVIEIANLLKVDVPTIKELYERMKKLENKNANSASRA